MLHSPFQAATAHRLVPLSLGQVFARINQNGDRLIGTILVFHLLLSLALAPVYDTWKLALVIGLTAVIMFVGVNWLVPGSRLARMAAGISLQAFVALHIYQMHGMAEMHFFFFTSVAALIIYQDWVALWPGVLLIILQHLLFAYLHNSGIQLYFFEQSYVGFFKLFFHFGIAIMHTVLCGSLAFLLREHTERQVTQQHQLNHQQKLLENIVTNYPEGALTLLDSNLNVLIYDGQYVRKNALPKETYLNQPASALMSRPDDYRVIFEPALQRALRGERVALDYEDQERILRIHIAPIFSEGKVERLLMTTDDITHMRQAERELAASLKEKEVLLAEIHHRVKNNLAVVSGLLQLQAQQTTTDEARRILEDSRMRIQAMAAVHDSLYRSENLARVNLSSYLEQLTYSLHRAYAKPDVQVTLYFSVAPVWLPVDLAIPCGLVATEVLTNAMKHAFVGRGEGKLTVTSGEGEGEIVLQFADNGVGLPKDMRQGRKNSLGLRILHGLVQQMDARLTIDAGPGGTMFTLAIPIRTD